MYLFVVEYGKKDVAVQDFLIVIMMQQLGNIFLQMYMFHLKCPSECGCLECRTDLITYESLEHLVAGFLHSS